MKPLNVSQENVFRKKVMVCKMSKTCPKTTPLLKVTPCKGLCKFRVYPSQ